jgi:hypothetical protein
LIDKINNLKKHSILYVNFYYITDPYDFGVDAVERMKVAAPQSLIDADFEYGMQPTKWVQFATMNDMPTVYESPGSDLIPTAASYATFIGGGGASAVGSNGNTGTGGGGNGGAGTATSITGSSVTYSGGGGGGSQTGGASPGTGGAGGGGNGTNTGTAPTAGGTNTGGGGGGAGDGSSSQTGAAGGSGIVIISIPTANYTGTTTGSPTVTTSGSNTIIKFTASGSYTA